MPTAMSLLVTVAIAFAVIVQCTGQFYFHQPLSSPQYAVPQPYARASAHPSVVANAEIESQLPSELLKSDRFYKNPRIAAALAKESWLTDKEMPVIEREAEKIPRDQVYKLFKNAGWIRRR